MPAIGYPSGTNTFVPNHEASQNLIVGFSRNPNTFKIPSYAQYVRAGNNVGLYFVWGSREGARIINPDNAENNWADGDAAPDGLNNLEGGYWNSFVCIRKAYAFTIGQMAAEQATYPILAAQAAVAAQKAMTARTMLTYTALSTASWGNNTASVPTLLGNAGYNWSNGSVGYDSNPGPNLKLSLQYGVRIINQYTIGVVQPSAIALLINPRGAQVAAASPEVQDYVKHSEFALAQLRGDVPNQNGQWGLPDMIYGQPLVVEDTVRVSSRKGSSVDTLGYVYPDGEAYLISRQGALEGIPGAPSYSTVQIFFYKDELTVFSKYDADNLRYMGRVVSNYVPVVTTTYAGFKFTSAF